jgi:hypothetical protein
MDMDDQISEEDDASEDEASSDEDGLGKEIDLEELKRRDNITDK